MVVEKRIIDESLDWIIDDDGCVLCPHCNENLQEKMDSNSLDVFGDSGICTVKDPCFCESSSSTIVYWKCPRCGKPISEFISWDN